VCCTRWRATTATRTSASSSPSRCCTAPRLLALPLPPKTEDEFANLARASSAKQRQIEAQDRVDFETYRRQYLDPQNLKI
jgi:hypothetical protein